MSSADSASAMEVPCSPSAEVAGVVYLPRMLAKIRLFAAGTLRADIHENMGKGLDAYLCDFLGVNYEAIRRRVLAGDSDEAVLTWCEGQSRRLTDSEKTIWRDFILKRGWRDPVADILVKRKAESGLAHRADIQTIAHYIDADEGRANAADLH